MSNNKLTLCPTHFYRGDKKFPGRAKDPRSPLVTVLTTQSYLVVVNEHQYYL